MRVLVVDDSAFMRKLLSDILEQDPQLQVVGTARDGEDALEKTRTLRPDVITLDVEMPRVDGLRFLERLMPEMPTPVVMVSSLTTRDAESTLQALSLGAVDFVAKPSGAVSLDIRKVAEEIRLKVKMAAGLSRERIAGLVWRNRQVRRAKRPTPDVKRARRLVVVGSSTGGPSALHRLLLGLPANIPAGVLAVQHMPPGFTSSLASRLDQAAAMLVREARHGDPILEGEALVAPGGYHMTMDSDGRIVLGQGPPRHGVRPAVDNTLASAASTYGHRVIGVVLTGMGRDGAEGAALVKRAGGKVLAEHHSTCAVYGMPRAVIETGLADRVVPLDHMAWAVIDALGELLKEEGRGSRSGVQTVPD